MGTFWKKISAIACTVGIVLGASSCDPARYSYDYEEYKDRVVTIELIEYNNPDLKLEEAGFLSFNSDFEAQNFYFEKCMVLETLDAQQNEEFLTDLAKHVTPIFDYPTNAPAGQALRIIYEDGSFTVLSWGFVEEVGCEYYGDFNADGSIMQYHGGKQGVEFYYMYIAANYFETKIELK